MLLRHGVPHRQCGHPVGVEPYDVHVGVKTPRLKPKKDALSVHVFDVEQFMIYLDSRKQSMRLLSKMHPSDAF